MHVLTGLQLRARILLAKEGARCPETLILTHKAPPELDVADVPHTTLVDVKKRDNTREVHNSTQQFLSTIQQNYSKVSTMSLDPRWGVLVEDTSLTTDHHGRKQTDGNSDFCVHMLKEQS